MLIYAYVHLTVDIWDKWEEAPVIVSFDDKSSQVWKIPFPAVTICSEVKNQRTKFNFSHVFGKFRRLEPLQDDEFVYFFYMTHSDELFFLDIITYKLCFTSVMFQWRKYSDTWTTLPMLMTMLMCSMDLGFITII